MSAVAEKQDHSVEEHKRLKTVINHCQKQGIDLENNQAYTAICRHGRIEVTAYKVFSEDHPRAQKALEVPAIVVDNDGCFQILHPEYTTTWVKDRVVHRFTIQL